MDKFSREKPFPRFLSSRSNLGDFTSGCVIRILHLFLISLYTYNNYANIQNTSVLSYIRVFVRYYDCPFFMHTSHSRGRAMDSWNISSLYRIIRLFIFSFSHHFLQRNYAVKVQYFMAMKICVYWIFRV